MIDEAKLELFRENLPYYRAFAGWSLENLAELLDISNTTAVKLENAPGGLRTIHMLAIQKLMENEFCMPHGNMLLANAVAILDDPENKGNSRVTRTELMTAVDRFRKTVPKKCGAAELCRVVNEWLMNELR